MSKNKLIYEEATPQQVTDAIKKRYEVKIKYGGNNEKGSGDRLIQPVAYGKSKSGNFVIRAFQPFGDTKTKVPHWKMFRLDKIDDWKPLKNRKFDEPPSSQWNSNGDFNEEGDKSMSEVLLVADFKGAKERYNDNLKKHNDDVHAKKVAENPYYDLKRNIKNSIKATPEIMKRIEDWKKEKEKKKGANYQSSNEMQSIKDFGNKDTTSTIGPITKNNVETNVQNSSDVNKDAYNNVSKNGPIYKNTDTETDNNEKENAKTGQQQDINDINVEDKNKEEIENNNNNGQE